ncbi:hypothetical protein VTO73DRAFT_1749 [Trametes versicolor]
MYPNVQHFLVQLDMTAVLQASGIKAQPVEMEVSLDEMYPARGPAAAEHWGHPHRQVVNQPHERLHQI